MEPCLNLGGAGGLKRMDANDQETCQALVTDWTMMGKEELKGDTWFVV